MRRAADAVLRLSLEERALGRRLPAALRLARLERIAEINSYHQRRNAVARRSHRKRRVKQLLAAGVRIPASQSQPSSGAL